MGGVASLTSLRKGDILDWQYLRWIVVDLLQTSLLSRHYRLWHDRALFHFFIQEADRAAYLSKLAASFVPEGRAFTLLLYDLNDLPLERFEWLILC